jgi:hypothetical protein
VKKIVLALILSLFSVSPLVFGESLKTDSSVEVKAGDAENNAVLADSGGNLYLEFSDKTRVVYALDHTLFTGEILAPTPIEQPGKSPRPRMREIISFEFMPDTGDNILFVDRLNTLHQANRIREKYTNPEGLISTARVKLIVPIGDPKIGNPKLWEYISDDEGWKRVGGKIEESSTDGIRIFSASMMNSGRFTVFDEAPAPTEFAQYQEELYPADEMSGQDIPFQSGNDDFSLDDSFLDELTVDTGSEFIDNAALLNNENSGLVPSLPGGENGTEIPAVQGSDENFSDVFKDTMTEPGVMNLETGLMETGSLKEKILDPVDNAQTLGVDADLKPSAPDIEIVSDSNLPKTGADESGISFAFPFIAFFVLGTLFASAWVAFRKE